MDWLCAALSAFNTAQAIQNLSLQAEVNLAIMLRFNGNPCLITKLCGPYIRYRSWLVVRKSAASGQELGTAFTLECLRFYGPLSVLFPIRLGVFW